MIPNLATEPYFRQERQGWLRLHEKGGKRHDVPAHHRAAELAGLHALRRVTRRAYAGALSQLDAWLNDRPLDDAALAAPAAGRHTHPQRSVR